VAAAFFVTLQPRLNSVVVAAKQIYQAAREVDCLRITESSAQNLRVDLDAIWQVADYVKHNDEWGEKLTPLQHRCLDALVGVDVAAADAEGKRVLTRWTVLSAACALSGETGETWLSAALAAIIQRSTEASLATERAIQTGFTKIAYAVEAVRERNAPRRGFEHRTSEWATKAGDRRLHRILARCGHEARLAGP
jgi:hypothetical protein